MHRYLECYLPDSGIEFALTMRYKQSPAAPLRSRAHKAAMARLAAAAAAVNDPTSSPASLAQAKAVLAEDDEASHAAAAAGPSSAGGEASTSTRLSANAGPSSSSTAPQVVLPPVTPPNVQPSSALLSKADLCILAVRPFRPGELIRCKGSITDLTKEEDEALREEAAHIRLAKRGRRKKRRGAAANDGAAPAEGQGEGEGSGDQKGAQEGANGDVDGEEDEEDEAGEDEEEEGNAVAAAAALAKKFKYKGVLGAGRDFSVIKSARKGCSQLFLGPARFINVSECSRSGGLAANSMLTGVYMHSIQHDCEPNVEFHRMGHQMTFRVIRPIAINEELTTYYGDNYFDVKNAECLCATCEARGGGAFTLAAKAEEETARYGSNGKSYGDMLRADSSSSNGAGDLRRPSSTRQAAVGAKEGISSNYHSPWGFVLPGTEEIRYDKGNSNTKDGNNTRKLMDEPEALQESAGGGNKGPQRECVTCGAHFWSRESWWKQEECGRCERHYKIFKADWPGREPTESLIARSKGKKPGEGIEKPSKVTKGKAKQEDHEPDADRRRSFGKRADRQASSSLARRGRASSSRESSSVASSTASPVVLTPLRDNDTASEDAHPASNGMARRKGGLHGKKKRKSASDLDMTDEDAIDEALGIERGSKHRKPSTAKRKAKKARVEEDEDAEMSDSDLSSLTSEDSEVSEEEQGDRADEKEPAPELGNETATRVAAPSESKEEQDRRRSTSSQPSSSASSSSSGSTGPKMLGKEAKTETLALYWGAVEGDRRSRRRSMNGPVALADTIKSERRVVSMGHRRTGSLVSNASIPGSQRGESSKAAPASPSRRKMRIVDDEEEESLGHVKKEKEGRQSGSPEGSSASPFATAASPRSRGSALATTPLATAPPAITSSAAAAQMTSALATTGTERTSVKNLALAWGVPVAEGRTRRSATKEPGVASPQSGPSSLKQRRSLRGGSAESSRAASSAFEEEDHSKRARGRSRQMQAEETSTPEREISQQRDEGSRAKSSASAPPEDEQMRRGSMQPKREESVLQKTPVISDTALPTFPSSAPALPTHSSSTASRIPPANLSGSPTFPFANGAALLNQDAPLKQPTRKNLRWGKGKVQMSRPMPLLGAHPGLQPGGSGPHALAGSPGPPFESESKSPRAQPAAAHLSAPFGLQPPASIGSGQLVPAAADTDKLLSDTEMRDVKEEPTIAGNAEEVQKEMLQYSQIGSSSVA